MQKILLLLPIFFLWSCLGAQPPRNQPLSGFQEAMQRQLAKYEELRDYEECLRRNGPALEAAKLGDAYGAFLTAQGKAAVEEAKKKILDAELALERIQQQVCPNRPKGMRKDDSIFTYADRIGDYSDELQCIHAGELGNARTLAQAEHLRLQCYNHLELKRIRRELERANKSKSQ